MAGAAVFIIVVSALAAGGWVGILVSPAGGPLAAALGVPAGLTYLGAFAWAGFAQWAEYERSPDAVLFPSEPGR